MRLRPMLEELAWKAVVPGLNDPWLRTRGALAAELRAHKPGSGQESSGLDAGGRTTA